MEEPRKEYSEDDSFDREKTSSEYGQNPRAGSDNSSDHLGGIAYDPDSTTGSGLSEAERNNQDGTNSREASHLGAEDLIHKYNINDKAHSDSSTDDFVKTTSSFGHADGAEPDSPGTL